MTQPETQTIDVVGLAVALGRVETKVDALTSTETRVSDRLTALEIAVGKLQTSQRPRTPWYSVVGAVVSIIVGCGALATLLVIANKIAEILA